MPLIVCEHCQFATSVALSQGVKRLSPLRQTRRYRSYTLQNAIGQDTLVATPIDTLKAGNLADVLTFGTRVSTQYDLMGRVTQSTTHGPSVSVPGMGTRPADTDLHGVHAASSPKACWGSRLALRRATNRDGSRPCRSCKLCHGGTEALVQPR